jgi:molybdopterin synthase sulfur carrier subunit
VNVKVFYFAGLREQVGMRGEDLQVPAGVTTVAGLRAMLMARGGAWQSALAQGKALRVAVNQEMAQPTTAVKAGDEVAFFPPVTGG